MKGAQITAIRVPTRENKYIQNIEQGIAWLAESLDDSVKIRSVKMEGLMVDEYTDFYLSEPYTITEKGIYVGYSFPKGNLLYKRTRNMDGYYLKETGKNYVRQSDQLVLQVRIKNHHVPEAAAHFESTTENITCPGEKTKAAFILYNDGRETIENIDYTINVDGQKESGHLDVEVLSGIGSSRMVFLDITGPTQPGKSYTVSLSIDKVNGKDNVNKDNVLKKTFKNQSRKILKRTLMEVGMGTWCPWSPRAFAGMNFVKEHYDDRVICIVWHNNDPMGKTNPFWSSPSSYFDRWEIHSYSDTEFDPYYDLDMLETVLQVPTDVEVSVKGIWNEDKTKVKATITTNYMDDNSKEKHKNDRIYYSLIADGLKGSSSDWYQNNGYSNYKVYADDPYLKPYVEASNPITNMVYDNVIIKSPTVYLTKPTLNVVISLPTDGELAEAIDKDKVYVVAYIANLGEHTSIANVAKAKVTIEGTGISSPAISDSSTSYDVYTASGVLIQKGAQSLKSLPKGLYIVNGRKVVVK